MQTKHKSVFHYLWQTNKYYGPAIVRALVVCQVIITVVVDVVFEK